jgi:hypothetical protein
LLLLEASERGRDRCLFDNLHHVFRWLFLFLHAFVGLLPFFSLFFFFPRLF